MAKDKLKNVSNAEIQVALEKNETVTEAARSLGVTKMALYLCIKRRGLKIETKHILRSID